MEGILGIFGIAILVMEGVELFHSSSTNTLVAAGVACVVYIFYKFGDFSKKDSPDEETDPPKRKKGSKHVWPFSQHMDDYIKEYQPEKYDDYCDAYGIVGTPQKKTDDLKAKEILDAAKYAKPSTQTVSEAMQSKPKYDPELDQLTPLFKPIHDHHLMLHLCYNSFEVNLTIWAFANKQFDMDRLSKQPDIMDAYRRAGSPPVDQPYVYVMVDPSTSKEPNKPKPYIPMDIRHTMCLGTDLVASVQRVIIELNHYFGSKPCYKFQYM